ncbi:MAG: hypothetical protein GY822_16950 [Deltaproteobacteria bacterium]|nr:hypothetical protein [Deltaproteobacteria bacterium]
MSMFPQNGQLQKDAGLAPFTRLSHQERTTGTGQVALFFVLSSIFISSVAAAQSYRPPPEKEPESDSALFGANTTPFTAYMGVDVDGLRHSALITRENTQIPVGGDTARTVKVRELDYERYRIRVTPRLNLGFARMIGVYAKVPVVVYDATTLHYTKGTDSTNSTIGRDQEPAPVNNIDGWGAIQGSGGNTYDTVNGQLQGYGFPNRSYNDWRFDPANNAGFTGLRAGLDYPTVGVWFAPVSNRSDSTKPTIRINLDFRVCVALKPMDPSNDSLAENDPGSVADGACRVHVGTYFSKRFLFLDPYFEANYTFPFKSADAVYGYEPRHDGGFTLGLKIIPWELPSIGSWFALDMHARAHYFSKGRDYSELSDALRELTYTDEFMRTSFNAGLHYQVFRYMRVSLVGSFVYDTKHFLTSESVGCDGGCRDPETFPWDYERGATSDKVELDESADERNQFFNPIYDTPGRRFVVDDSYQLRVLAKVAFTF